MKKRNIVAMALVITMAMPMTAMAERKSMPLGQTTTIYAGWGEAGDFQYDVVDADTFYATRAWGIGVSPTLRSAIQAVVPADYDVYYVRETTVKGSGARLSEYGLVLDGQECLKANAEFIALSETGGVTNLYNIPADFRSITSGQRWTVTINGQVYDKVMYIRGDIAGSIWVVPKVASSVRALFTGITSGSATAATNYADMGLPDWDNAYYIDLKTGTNTASAQPQTTGATPMWKQNAKGWWLERPDGSYLVNEWYLYNGQWYYMGSDGYMMTNTTTPDGYRVNADGVWVQ